MFFDDEEYLDGPFGDEDFQADEEALCEIRREQERIRAMPIMKKALSLFELVKALIGVMPLQSEFACHYKDVMITDAALICAKINSAETMDFYSIKMEHAVLIKVAANNLSVQAAGLEMLELIPEEYCRLLEMEVEEFRLCFVEWISGFSRAQDLPDPWGLFP